MPSIRSASRKHPIKTLQVTVGGNLTTRIPLTGVLIANKPTGATSRDVVDRVAHGVRGAKVGHAGTLDPLASGLLIVCIGPATRLVEMLHQLSKSYRTVVHLGARSDTLDADGRIEVETSPRVPSDREVQEVLPRFLGHVAQLPPDYSALKVKGHRAYDLAQPARWSNSLRAWYRSIGSLCSATIGRYWSWKSIVAPERTSDRLHVTWERRWAVAGTWRACSEPGSAHSPSIRRWTRLHYRLTRSIDTCGLRSMPFRVCLGSRSIVFRSRPSCQGRRLPGRELSDGRAIPEGQVALLDPDGNLVALAEHDPSAGWLQPRKVLM